MRGFVEISSDSGYEVWISYYSFLNNQIIRNQSQNIFYDEKKGVRKLRYKEIRETWRNKTQEGYFPSSRRETKHVKNDKTTFVKSF